MKEKLSSTLTMSSLILGVGILATGCGAGEPEPGTPALEDTITYIELDDVFDPNGNKVICTYINSSGSHPTDITEDNPWAFAAVSCDYAGVADFTGRLQKPLSD